MRLRDQCKNRAEAENALLSEMEEIFPSRGKALFEHHKRILSEKPLPTLKQLKEGQKKITYGAGKGVDKTTEKLVERQKFSGTATLRVPCPECGKKKRCDENTKRFKCQCGFEGGFENGEVVVT